MEARYIAFKQAIRVVDLAAWEELALHGAPITTIGIADFPKIKELVYRERFGSIASNMPLLAEIVETKEKATHFVVKAPYKSNRIFAISDFDDINEGEEVLLIRRLEYELHAMMDIKPIRK